MHIYCCVLLIFLFGCQFAIKSTSENSKSCQFQIQIKHYGNFQIHMIVPTLRVELSTCTILKWIVRSNTFGIAFNSIFLQVFTKYTTRYNEQKVYYIPNFLLRGYTSIFKNDILETKSTNFIAWETFSIWSENCFSKEGRNVYRFWHFKFALVFTKFLD